MPNTETLSVDIPPRYCPLPTAIGEPAPAQQERRARLLSGDGCDFTRRVLSALGGTAVDSDLRMNQPEEARLPWQLPRPTVESLRYYIPDNIHTVAVIASIDLEAQPTAVFDHHSRWRAKTTQPSGTTLSFEPAPFTSGETVSNVAEIRRHASG
ncbi:hypothetical protein J7F01_40995 [Streptomyces sp. ISL-22]|uniref:hypothetical protein n=1 Tax=unclassified Streptomyces TaxID=2593676 RepID=UPI001BE959FC|nr:MULTISPECIES: hypothetical protein [unclassified Streptomyces]MBT2423688.1 hypothetical protein [Streptomyces sp. ISL-24]MBT2438372.1 hypothetical protein [Streptomyces sp. ISL-22]